MELETTKPKRTALLLRDLYICYLCEAVIPKGFGTRCRECLSLVCPDCVADNCQACELQRPAEEA